MPKTQPTNKAPRLDDDASVTLGEIQRNREEILNLEIPNSSNNVFELSLLLPDPALTEALNEVFGNQARLLTGGIDLNLETGKAPAGTTIMLYSGSQSNHLYEDRIESTLQIFNRVVDALKALGIEVILVEHQVGNITMDRTMSQGLDVARKFKATFINHNATIIDVLATGLRKIGVKIYAFSEISELPVRIAEILNSES
jgi:hypothetical protein